MAQQVYFIQHIFPPREIADPDEKQALIKYMRSVVFSEAIDEIADEKKHTIQFTFIWDKVDRGDRLFEPYDRLIIKVVIDEEVEKEI